MTVENPNAGQLEAAVEAHREADWAGHGSSVVALMAHGHEKRIECQDGTELPLTRIFGFLSTAAAPKLVGKPKVWLVQACRRGESQLTEARRDTGVPRGARGAGGAAEREERRADVTGAVVAASSAAATSCEARDAQHDAPCDAPRDAQDDVLPGERRLVEDASVLCEEHDHLWGYAATPGSPAYRGAMFGAFRKVVETHGERESWLALLQHTNELCACASSRTPVPSKWRLNPSTLAGPPV